MITRNHRRILPAALILSLTASLLIPQPPVLAQQAQSPRAKQSRLLEEIVVTARRREESMQDIPVSVVAVTAGEIEQQGVQSLGDITLQVPNFSFQDRGSILGNFGMRGIVTNVENAGVESGMAVYVDGVLVGRPEIFDLALRDVAQVEVLRGPQGTLFGKNTIAGAVNIITPRPTDELEGNVKLEAGRYDRYLIGGTVNVPFSDTFKGRFSGTVEQQDGWIDNIFDGRDFNGEDNVSGRAQLLFTPSEQLEFYWTGDFFSDDRNFIAQVNDDPRDLKDNPAVNIFDGTVDLDNESTSDREIWGTSLEVNFETANGHTFTSLTGYREAEVNSLYDGDTQRQALSDTKRDMEFEDFTQEFRIQSPADDKFTWVAGVNYQNQQIDNDTQTRFFPSSILAGCNVGVVPNTFRGFPPGPPFEPTSRIRGFDANGFPVWDFDLNGNGVFNEPDVTIPPFGLFGVPEDVGCHNPDLIAFGRHLAGGDAMDQFVVGDPGLGFDTPLTSADVPDVAQVLETGTLDTEVFALFAHGDYRVTDRLTVTAGIRHTWEDKELDMTQIGMINIQRPSFVKVDDRSDSEFSGTAGISYQFTDEFMGYAKWSRGFKSGGFQFDITQGENVGPFAAWFQNPANVQGFLAANPGATKADVINAAIAATTDPNAPPENVEFGPEQVDVWEFGFKSDLFGNTLRLNAAYFFTDYTEVQQNITRLATGIVVLNVPEAEIRGFDVDLTALLTPNLTFSGGLGYANTELTEPLIIPNPQNPQVPLVDSSGFVGQRLAQAPDVTANASLVYQFEVGGTGTVVLRGDWSYTGEILHELVENGSPLEDIVTEDGYSIVNTRVGYISDRGNWEVFLWGKNVFDEEYVAFRRANPIIRVFGLDQSGMGLAFPGSETAQAIAGFPQTWGVTFTKRFSQ